MWNESLNTKIKEMLDEIEKLDEHYREIYDKSVDISSMKISQEVQFDSYIKIRKLKDWKKDILRLYNDMESDDEIEFFVAREKAIRSIEHDKIDRKYRVKNKDNCVFLEKPGKAVVKPISIRLFEEFYLLRSWEEALFKICEILILKKPQIISRFDKEYVINNRNVNFSYDEEKILGNRKRLSNGMWINASMDKKEIIVVIYRILDLCGYSEEDFKVAF